MPTNNSKRYRPLSFRDSPSEHTIPGEAAGTVLARQHGKSVSKAASISRIGRRTAFLRFLRSTADCYGFKNPLRASRLQVCHYYLT